MKTLIVLAFVLGITTGLFAKDKLVMYDKDTKEIQAVVISTSAVKNDTSIRNIYLEKDVISYGTTDKMSIIAIDEKTLPADITTKTYKIDTDKKEIFEEVILEEIK